jgi:uncharacterized OB-fold protein
MSGPAVPVRPVPITNDHDTAGFFEACAQGKLVVRSCTNCGAVYALPRDYCRECSQWSMGWKEVSGDAVLYSYTVTEHQIHPAFAVPYTVVLVELVDEPTIRMVGSIPGVHELAIGTPMRVWFEEVADGISLAQWRVR